MSLSFTARAPAFPLDLFTRRYALSMLGVIAAIVVGCLALAVFRDVAAVEMFAENGPVEDLQVGLYVLAVAGFGYSAWSVPERLHRLTFCGLALAVACLVLRELDFTRSGTPVLAALFNSRGTIVVAAAAWLALAWNARREILDVAVAGLRWLAGRGGRPLLVAAALLLFGGLFDHHAFPIGRTADMVAEETLELLSGAFVLLSAIAAVRVVAGGRRRI